MDENEIGTVVVDCAVRLHRSFGLDCWKQFMKPFCPSNGFA